MSAETLHQIQISVKTWFRDDLSKLDDGSFFFNYEITIHNAGDLEVQLLRRYWRIDHLTVGSNVVTGEGVIGEQPVIEPKHSYSYTSGCELYSSMGRMVGYYQFKELASGTTFTVPIPSFTLIFPPILN
jgi:ApaG protein